MAMYVAKVSIQTGRTGMLSHVTTKTYSAIVPAANSIEAKKYVCKALELARDENTRSVAIEIFDFENGVVLLLKEGGEIHSTRHLY